MSLVQYGVTNDSRVILSVKDADSNTASSTSSVAAAAACCSKQPELSSELMSVLLRHFTPADAERVAEEFKQVAYISFNLLVIFHCYLASGRDSCASFLWIVIAASLLGVFRISEVDLHCAQLVLEWMAHVWTATPPQYHCQLPPQNPRAFSKNRFF